MKKIAMISLLASTILLSSCGHFRGKCSSCATHNACQCQQGKECQCKDQCTCGKAGEAKKEDCPDCKGK